MFLKFKDQKDLPVIINTANIISITPFLEGCVVTTLGHGSYKLKDSLDQVWETINDMINNN